MFLFNTLKKIFNNQKNFTGALDDTRPQVEKDQDYRAEEFAMFAPVEWKEKTPDQFTKYPTRNQDGSFTCMAQAGAKELGVDNVKETGEFIELSAFDIYDWRVNKYDGGMGLWDLLNILSTKGACLESQLPSQNLDEVAANKPVIRTQEMIATAQKYKGGGYAYLRENDIEQIGSCIQHQKKAPVLMFFFTMDEWNQDVPKIIDTSLERSSSKALRHGVVGVDTIVWNGQKAIVIDDSWGKFYGLDGQRIITEEFLKKRCYGAGYVLDLSNNWNQPKPPTKPKVKITNPIVFGSKGNEVKMLQAVLKYEKFFPANVALTGNALHITMKGARQWQLAHGIMDFAKETNPRVIRFGPKSIALINNLYA